MTWKLPTSDPSPWPASAAAHILGRVVRPTYTVLVDGIAVPARDLVVTLDGTQEVAGVIEFALPLDPYGLTATWWNRFDPKTAHQVAVKAGWIIGGTDYQNWLCVGKITSRTRRRAATGSVVKVKAQTAEVGFDWPSNRAYSVSNTFTTLKQATDAMAAASTPFYPCPGLGSVALEAGLPTPTSAQLTAYRGLELKTNDNFGGFLRKCAATLGQRWRADWRTGASATIVTTETNTAAGTPLVLGPLASYPDSPPSSLIFEVEHSEDLEDWADVLDLSATWTAETTGTTKTARKVYAATGSYPAITRSRQVTVDAYPPGGVLPTSWNLAQRWLDYILRAERLTFTTRAVWWLMPWDRVNIGDQLTGTSSYTLVTISRVVFHVDAGTMTVSGTVS